MKKDFTFPSADGKTAIHAAEWIPEGEVRAVLQIAHGMVEYIMRYAAFAEFLAAHGIYVVGNDHLGHGESVTSDEEHGFFADRKKGSGKVFPEAGNICVIEDIHQLRTITREKYPDVPYFLLGHSMGSFLIRQYIEIYGKGIAGTIIMGTGSQPLPVLKMGETICRVVAAAKGWHHRSALVNNMAFAGNNKAFQQENSPVAWLSKNTESTEAYRHDPWCTFVFTVNGFYNMFRGIEYCQDPKHIQRIPKEMPILLVSGQDDPVGGMGKGVRQAYEQLRNYGPNKVEMKLYEGDRHEILNELDRETVYQDMLGFIEKNL